MSIIINNEERLMVNVGRLYYNKQLTQQEVADKLNLSRPKVQRLLQKARENGIIEVKIKHPLEPCLELQERMLEQYDLKDVLIVESEMTRDQTVAKLGQAGSRIIEKKIVPNTIMAVPWGQAVFEVTNNLKEMEVHGVRVVTSFGGLLSDNHMNPYTAVYKVASKLHARCDFLSAPAIVNSIEAKELFMEEPNIKEVLDIARNADLTFLGIGNVNPDSTLVKTGYLDNETIKSLKKMGAVGNSMGQFYKIDGKLLDCDVNKRIIGLTLEEISNIDCVIGIAGGKDKVLPILGALRGNWVDILVTDADTAADVLSLNKTNINIEKYI